MDYCIKGCNHVRIALVADNHRCHFIYNPRSHHIACVLQCIITGAKAIADGIAMGVDVDSTNMSDHMEYIVHGSKNQIDSSIFTYFGASFETNATFRSADYRSWSRIGGCL